MAKDLGRSWRIAARSVATLAVLLLSAPAFAEQYPTIVGEWYGEDYGDQDCGTPRAVHIGAMSFAEDSYVCRFKDVARDGWTVTWNGSCNDGSTVEKTRLMATESNGRLTTFWNGRAAAIALRRCNAKSSSLPTLGVNTTQVALSYTAYDASTDLARAYWGDAIAMVDTFDPPPIFPVTVQIAESAGLTFAYVTGGMLCGMGNHGCPIRVFSDGHLLAEFSACENLSSHKVASDGSRFFGCNGQPSFTIPTVH